MGFLGELLEDITGKSNRPEIKGSRFEGFVLDEIFLDKLFDLVEMTRDFKSNSKRFEERSMKPDFLFRDKRTGEEFWIEAKYRKGLFRNKKGQEVCEICKPQQLTTDKHTIIPFFDWTEYFFRIAMETHFGEKYENKRRGSKKRYNSWYITSNNPYIHIFSAIGCQN